MSDQTIKADGIIPKNPVAKYADSIIRWGGFWRRVLTVIGWISLIAGPIVGVVIVKGSSEGPGMTFLYFLYCLLVGLAGLLLMFTYRLIFDYMLMKAHQSRI